MNCCNTNLTLPVDLDVSSAGVGIAALVWQHTDFFFNARNSELYDKILFKITTENLQYNGSGVW